MHDFLEELKAKKIWVLWKKIEKNKRPTKKPISATGGITGTNAEYANTWVTYDKATSATRRVNCSGVGFVIPEGYFFLDIDDVDLEDPFVKSIISRFGSYAERSISGNGIHIYGSCDFNKLPTCIDSNGNLKLSQDYYTKNPHNKMELYIGGLTNRFAVFSGDVIYNAPLKDCTDAILITLETDMRRKKAAEADNGLGNTKALDSPSINEAPDLDDAFDVICNLRRQKNGEKFIRLYNNGDTSGYNSQSEADLALCNLIAFRTGDNPELIDDIFRHSALYRDKWERNDYRNNTINAAIRNAAGKYNPASGDIPEFVIIDSRTHRQYVHAAILARCFRKKVPMLLVRDNGKQGTLIYIYEDGVYKLQSADMFKGRIKKFVTDYDDTLLKMRDINEAYNILITDLKTIGQDELNSNEAIINFTNGLLKVDKEYFVLQPHTYEEFSTIQIPCEWENTSSPTPVFDKYLDTLTNGDEDIKELLLEFIGVCLSNIKGWRMKKALFLVGAGDTGKSQLKALTEMLLGKGNFVGIDLKEIEARFGTGSIYGTRLAGASDMSFMSISELKTFKKITGGDSLFAEFKGQQGFEYTYNGLLWFCMNRLPKFGGDDGKWVYNRIMIVNCPNVIPKDKQDKELLDKMYAERNGIVFKAVKALQNVLKNSYNFIEPEALVKARQEYQEENSSVISFFNECMCKVTDTKTSGHCTTGTIYKVYKAWCQDNNSGYAKTAKEFRNELADSLETTFDEMTTKINGYNYYKEFTLNDFAKNQYKEACNNDCVDFENTDNPFL